MCRPAPRPPKMFNQLSADGGQARPSAGYHPAARGVKAHGTQQVVRRGQPYRRAAAALRM